MEYDVYCAICGVAFCGFEIGPWSPAALEQRDCYVDGEMSKKEAEENAPVGYEPRLVDLDDCDWLLDVYCLGYNKMQLSSLAIVSNVVDSGECMRVEERRRLEREEHMRSGLGSESEEGWGSISEDSIRSDESTLSEESMQ
jgi:hypothetical protein